MVLSPCSDKTLLKLQQMVQKWLWPTLKVSKRSTLLSKPIFTTHLSTPSLENFWILKFTLSTSHQGKLNLTRDLPCSVSFSTENSEATTITHTLNNGSQTTRQMDGTNTKTTSTTHKMMRTSSTESSFVHSTTLISGDTRDPWPLHHVMRTFSGLFWRRFKISLIDNFGTSRTTGERILTSSTAWKVTTDQFSH